MRRWMHSTASTPSLLELSLGFGVLRDPIACKPAVMAESDRWVAFGTEYRALVNLLAGIDAAKVWEPEPAKVYLWERHNAHDSSGAHARARAQL